MSKQSTFISYSREDIKFVEKMAQDLRKAGADIWIDQLDIAAGARWDQEIENALQSTRSLIVVLSPNSVQSHNVIDEVSFAMEEGKTVLPIMIKECEVPFRLRRLQRIDFVKNYDSGLKKLIKTLSKLKKGKYKSASVDSVEQKKSSVSKAASRGSGPSPQQGSGRSKRTYLVIASVFLIVVIGGYGLYRFLPTGQSPEAMESMTISKETGVSGSTSNGHSAQDGESGENASGTSDPKALDKPDMAEILGKYISLDNERRKGAMANSELVDLLVAFKTEYGNALDEEKHTMMDEWISSLRESRELLAEAIIKDEDAASTLWVKRNLWFNMVSDLTYPADQVLARQRLQAYEKIMSTWASVRDDDANFNLCYGVVSKNCKQPSNRFPKNTSVWVWAKLSVPSKETVRFEWYNARNRTIFGTSTTPVTGPSNGYRTWKAQYISNPGQYVARLYNSQNHLIGRREFTVY